LTRYVLLLGATNGWNVECVFSIWLFSYLIVGFPKHILYVVEIEVVWDSEWLVKDILWFLYNTQNPSYQVVLLVFSWLWNSSYIEFFFENSMCGWFFWMLANGIEFSTSIYHTSNPTYTIACIVSFGFSECNTNTITST
jgi:hypothetical protein